METRRIRPIAIGIIWRDRELLVQHGMDPDSGASFFRPPGGAIEFGERAADALRREFLEELQAQLAGVELLTVLENPFTYKGEAFHEIVFVCRRRPPGRHSTIWDTTMRRCTRPGLIEVLRLRCS